MTSEAAERLRNSPRLSVFQKRDLDAALAEERRATVERIRVALAGLNWLIASEADIRAILDAERDR